MRTINIILKELSRIEKLKFDQIKPITTDAYQFEINRKKTYRYETIKFILEYLSDKSKLIGTEVYISVKSFYFTSTFFYNDNIDLNEIEPIVLTEDIFIEYVKRYLEDRMKGIEEWLLTQRLSLDSINTMSNLTHDWFLVSKQDLYTFYSDLLETLENI